MVTDAKIEKVRDGEKNGTNGKVVGDSFFVSIVRTARNVVACSNQFGGAVLSSVFNKEVRDEVKATSFNISSIVNSWSSRDQQFDGVCGMTKGQRNKSVATSGNG